MPLWTLDELAKLGQLVPETASADIEYRSDSSKSVTVTSSSPCPATRVQDLKIARGQSGRA